MLFLQLSRHAGNYRGLDDRGLSFADERECFFDNTSVEAAWRGGGRHCDEYDIAMLYLVFIFAVRLFERIADSLVPPRFKIVGIVLANISLPHKSDKWFRHSHRRASLFTFLALCASRDIFAIHPNIVFEILIRIVFELPRPRTTLEPLGERISEFFLRRHDRSRFARNAD